MTEPRHLFVYGTLRPDATTSLGAPERRRLMAESRVVEAATVHGWLYDLGAYPALVAGQGAEVHGVLLALADPCATFRWLDPYEGIDPSGDTTPGGAEYARVVLAACLAGGAGGDVAAWVYVYRQAPVGVAIVPDGRWAG